MIPGDGWCNYDYYSDRGKPCDTRLYPSRTIVVSPIQSLVPGYHSGMSKPQSFIAAMYGPLGVTVPLEVAQRITEVCK